MCVTSCMQGTRHGAVGVVVGGHPLHFVAACRDARAGSWAWQTLQPIPWAWAVRVWWEARALACGATAADRHGRRRHCVRIDRYVVTVDVAVSPSLRLPPAAATSFLQLSKNQDMGRRWKLVDGCIWFVVHRSSWVSPYSQDGLDCNLRLRAFLSCTMPEFQFYLHCVFLCCNHVCQVRRGAMNSIIIRSHAARPLARALDQT